MNTPTRTKDQFEDDFQDKIVKTIPDIYARQTAEMIEYFSEKLDDYANLVARERFEKAMVRKSECNCNPDWDYCRAEIIKRWNESK